jgi:hypothetical protein
VTFYDTRKLYRNLLLVVSMTYMKLGVHSRQDVHTLECSSTLGSKSLGLQEPWAPSALGSQDYTNACVVVVVVVVGLGNSVIEY